ncbi:MAG: M48 family metallopeptidase [Nanoarchaeota archaeon]|nr:M48 family metallopeptidase [Nanoarchaeota archaeon]
MKSISFHDQISRNKRKSIFLIFVILLVLILLSYVIGLIYPDYFFIILILGIIISLSYILTSYYNSDKIALASVNAKPASYEKHRQIHNIVEGICLASGLPKPKIYILEDKQINAFATGRDPKHSVICLTTGAIEKLDKQELEGVIGHELSHISNYDIRFMTLVTVMVGMIAIISQIFLRSLWFSGNRNRNKSNAIIMIIGIVLAILAPLVVTIVQMTISRKREYVADASSVKFIRSPTGLIRALKKIKQEHEPMKVSGAVSPLFISDPLKKKLSGLFQTHPPINKRIEVLERM